MLPRAGKFLAISTFITLGAARAAVAEPISFLYTVQVVSANGPDSSPQPYRPPSFALVATFDDQVTAAFEGPNSRNEYYGRVQFSPLPDFLPAPSSYAGRPLIDEFPPDSENGFFETPEVGGFGHGGRLGSTLHQPRVNFTGGSDYAQSILLFSSIRGLAAAPVLTPRTLAQLVGTPNGDPNFLFEVAKFDLNTAEQIDFVSYQGFATFRGQVEPPAPVPEPATLILLATGVAVVGRRARKHRKDLSRRTTGP